MLSFVKSAWPCVMALCMLCISASLSSLAYAKVEETHSDAMEAVMQNVLTRAIEIAELENASIHRSLKQAFDFETGPSLHWHTVASAIKATTIDRFRFEPEVVDGDLCAF